MRIYTEVIFNWDDKQDKLVETSSKFFEANLDPMKGEIALCYGLVSGGWFRDSQGNDYQVFLQYKTWAGKKKYNYQYAEDKNGNVVWRAAYGDDYWKKQDAIDNATRGLEKKSNTGVLYAKSSADDIPSKWYTQYANTYGMKASGIAELDLKWATEYFVMNENQQYDAREKAQQFGDTVSEEYWTVPEGDVTEGAGTDVGDPQNPYADEKGSQNWWDWETTPGNNPDFDEDLYKKTTNIGLINKGIQYELVADPIELGEGAVSTKTTIETIMTDWAAIVDPTRPDIYQDALERAVDELGFAEDDIIDAYNTLQGKFEELGEDYTTDVEELIGHRIVDPVTGEVISEGTYLEDIRVIEKLKEEGLETEIVTREGELEALREEAVGEIRAAEAKIGAAGFASTGVGQTAREILAEDIGRAAEDIDVEFVEGRELVKEAFVEEKGRLTKERNISLGEYTKTRDRLARESAGDWKGKTLAYERLLESYDAIKGETGAYTLPGVTAPGETVAGGIAAQAEAGLTGIQADIESMIELMRKGEGFEDWDPFTAGGVNLEERTALFGKGTEYGWDAISKTFTTAYPEGLFDPTLQELQYTPATDLQLYDPEFRLPWEIGTEDIQPDKPYKPRGQR